MTNEFKRHTIIRDCDKNYKDYHNYKEYLKKDFKNRCAYCNMHDKWIMPLPYQIDHFIPRVECKKAGRNDLDHDYRNLMYSCPVCNRLKSNIFEEKFRKMRSVIHIFIIRWIPTIIIFFQG